MSRFFAGLFLALIAMGVFFLSPSAEAGGGGCASLVRVTPAMTVVWGELTEATGRPLPVGTMVVAYSPRDEIVGCFEVSTAGFYGSMSIYGEVTYPWGEIITPGMRSGEPVRFALGDGKLVLPSPPRSFLFENDYDWHRLDLVVHAPNPPTATPTATNTATATPTSTPAPTDTPTNTATNTAMPTDQVGPICRLIGMSENQHGQRYQRYAVRDTGSGLREITIQRQTNVLVRISSFTPGTTTPVVVAVTQLDQTQFGAAVFRFTDKVGNTGFCDPSFPARKTGSVPRGH